MSQDNKFTPGPWRVQHPIGIGSIQVTAARKTYPIALVFTRLYIQEEDIANARLISAAPELLAALVLARDIIVANDVSIPRTLEVIDAAISKAKGEH